MILGMGDGGRKKTSPPKHTVEFKQRSVQIYRERGGGTYTEIGRELGVDPGSASDWVRRADAASSSEDNLFQMAEDLRRLKRENEKLLKASAFFASRQL